MRTAALVALLPCLATLATAHSHDHHQHNGRTRKSLSFGPNHDHASFELIQHQPVTVETGSFAAHAVDPLEVAKVFIADKLGKAEGEGFYLREDSYTDSRTHVTHVYARQLINGLEVSDGDINLNIDRDGRVISWGNSFHPGDEGAAFGQGTSGERERICKALHETLNSHREAYVRVKPETGAWAIVKAAAKAVLGSTSDSITGDEQLAHVLKKNMKHVKHHLKAMCHDDSVSISSTGLSPVEALATLLPRLSRKAKLDTASVTSTVHHSLAPKPAPAEPPTEVISGAGLADAHVVSDVPARLMYTQVSEGAAPRLVWKLEVEMQHNWYEAYVDVESGDILRIVDWASDSPIDQPMKAKKAPKQKPLPLPPTTYEEYSYQVFPWGINDPTTGNLTVVTKPWDTVASPLGWHAFPTAANPYYGVEFPGSSTADNITTIASTVGNNVIAHEDWEGRNNYLTNYRPVNESFVFVYDYGEPDGLAPKEYIDLVTTQLFYTCNAYHDLLYRLGFDEVSGNFQVYNFGKGGKGGDAVIANAQDGSGYNNANFMTPPDGTAPRMRMYIWDTATPYRDGDLEAGIVIHEYSHGLSTRLTGGPANSGCLGYAEAGGMGEGWGDAIATLIRQIEEHKAFVNGTDTFAMGAWAANQDSGIRNYKYSTNSTTNPSTYKTLDKPGYWGVHAIGEVWAEFLFVMTERMIEKYGFSTTLFPPEDPSTPNDYYTKTVADSIDSLGRPVPLVPKHGNTLALQLVISAMKIQPCRPTFFDARDAIISADQILTGGDNACLIWKAFAERGLGSDAEIVGQTPWGGGIRSDGFEIPAKVCK